MKCVELMFRCLTPGRAILRLSKPTLELHLKSIARRAGAKQLSEPVVAYSTLGRNTGFTGFIASEGVTIALNHWDDVDPGILQYNVLFVTSDESAALNRSRGIVNQVVRWWKATLTDQATLRRAEEFQFQQTARRLAESILEASDYYLHHTELFVRASRALDNLKGPSIAMLAGHLTDFVKALDMQSLTAPLVVRFRPQSRFNCAGLIGITTSHISLRAYASAGRLYVQYNVFSCQSFSEVSSITMIKKFWTAEIEQVGWLRRNPRFEYDKVSV